MRHDWLAEMEKKNRFLSCLEETLLVDQKRNGLESLTYTYDLESKAETVILKFKSGTEKTIRVNGTSNGMILRDITKAVYEPW